jgi:hypothetical protein
VIMVSALPLSKAVPPQNKLTPALPLWAMMISKPAAAWAGQELQRSSSMTSVAPLQEMHSVSHWTSRRLCQTQLKSQVYLEAAALFRRAVGMHIGFEVGLRNAPSQSCSRSEPVANRTIDLEPGLSPKGGKGEEASLFCQTGS